MTDTQLRQSDICTSPFISYSRGRPATGGTGAAAKEVGSVAAGAAGYLHDMTGEDRDEQKEQR